MTGIFGLLNNIRVTLHTNILTQARTLYATGITLGRRGRFCSPIRRSHYEPLVRQQSTARTNTALRIEGRTTRGSLRCSTSTNWHNRNG